MLLFIGVEPVIPKPWRRRLPPLRQADLFTAAEFDADKAAQYDAIAFGCPSMGAEQLEDSEFEPMFEAVKASLPGKKVALFGSYGWGGGEWMRTWESDCQAVGITLAAESVICQDEPDEDALATCAKLGEAAPLRNNQHSHVKEHSHPSLTPLHTQKATKDSRSSGCLFNIYHRA